MRERLEVTSCPTCWPKELMSLSGLTPEEKSEVMRDNWKLMVAVLRTWDMMQADLQRDDVDRMVKLLQGEWQEVLEVIQELLDNKLEDLKGREWYEVDGGRRWKIGSELADVMVLTFALWKMQGFQEKQLLDFLSGNGKNVEVDENKVDVFYDLRKTIFDIKNLVDSFGVDLAEMTILKTLINYQHRPPFLEIEWRKNGFMKKMRREIGDATSQMPDLGLVIGPTVLAKYIDEENRYFANKALIRFMGWEQRRERWLEAQKPTENLGYPGNDVLPWASLKRI